MANKKNPFAGTRKFWMVYLLILPAFAFTFVFYYIPIMGLATAFKDYNIMKGFWASPWAGSFGFANIVKLVNNKALIASVANTVYLSVLNLLIGTPAPIILALLVNELRVGKFKKTVQTVSYMPFFLSWITVVGLVVVFFGTYGPVNDVINIFNPDRTRVLYLSEQKYFLPILLGSNIWKTIGYNSIIYISAISSIDPQLYEAATVDGAGKWKQMLHITFPGLSMTIIVLFVLNIGGLLASNFELVYGLVNPYINFEVIDTVIYKQGLLGRNYSMGTALGFTRGVIALALVLGVNYISRKIYKISIL